MKPWNLYKYQRSLDYNHNIAGYDWAVKTIDEEKTIYVFTQFSVTLLDWIVNFLFMVIPQVRHWFVYFTPLGWQTAFNACKQLIMNKVLTEMNNHPDYKVVCSGHSYGGAASVLVGIEIFFASAIKPDLITWGAPKPLFLFFTKLVVKFFFKDVKQYAHVCDIPSYMPPLPGYWNLKVKRLGKFSFKALFNQVETHHCYDDKELYIGVEE